MSETKERPLRCVYSSNPGWHVDDDEPKTEAQAEKAEIALGQELPGQRPQALSEFVRERIRHWRRNGVKIPYTEAD